MTMTVAVREHTDPACPWAYSASPALAVLRWRYGDGLDWRLVTIGLTERAGQYVERGYTPSASAQGYVRFRRYGMPFSPVPRPRMMATARACRAIVATRLLAPRRERAVFRALQLAYFTTALVLDEDDALAAALAPVAELDVDGILTRLDDPEVTRAYEADRAEARTAAGSPTEAQGKAARTDGRVRYTAPSLVFERDGQVLEAGGFQPVEAYDVLLANLDPALPRTPPPPGPLPILERFPDGLATAEVAAILAVGNEPPEREAAELSLIELTAAGQAVRQGVGDDAIWALARAPVPAAA